MRKFTTKTEKIIHLTKNKTKQLTLMLNEDLISMFKAAAEQDNIKITKLIEGWVINYLDQNGYLEN